MVRQYQAGHREMAQAMGVRVSASKRKFPSDRLAECRIEVLVRDDYWVESSFADLRPGDRFRYAHERWIDYRCRTLPRMHPEHSVPFVEVDKKRIRWTRERLMATIKKGLTEKAREMWTHLRPWGKRDFWKRQRAADRRKLREEP